MLDLVLPGFPRYDPPGLRLNPWAHGWVTNVVDRQHGPFDEAHITTVIVHHSAPHDVARQVAYRVAIDLGSDYVREWEFSRTLMQAATAVIAYWNSVANQPPITRYDLEQIDSAIKTKGWANIVSDFGTWTIS